MIRKHHDWMFVTLHYQALSVFGGGRGWLGWLAVAVFCDYSVFVITVPDHCSSDCYVQVIAHQWHDPRSSPGLSYVACDLLHCICVEKSYSIAMATVQSVTDGRSVLSRD